MITEYEEKQINELVYLKYPLTKLETTCQTERDHMAGLRNRYRRRLESEIEQSKIQSIASKQNEFL